MVSAVFFVSRSTEPRGHLSDLDILSTSEKLNAEQNITGCLLRAATWFAGSFEGSDAAVNDLFQRILKDGRHSDIHYWPSHTNSARLFPEWRMVMGGAIKDEDALFDVLQEPDLALGHKQSILSSMLQHHTTHAGGRRPHF